MTTDQVERLQEIQEEMLALLDEAKDILRRSDNKFLYEQARSYWLAHIKTALTNNHDYLGGSMVTMEDTIHGLEADEGEDENDI
jgi:hypothetical protein